MLSRIFKKFRRKPAPQTLAESRAEGLAHGLKAAEAIERLKARGVNRTVSPKGEDLIRLFRQSQRTAPEVIESLMTVRGNIDQTRTALANDDLAFVSKVLDQTVEDLDGILQELVK